MNDQMEKGAPSGVKAIKIPRQALALGAIIVFDIILIIMGIPNVVAYALLGLSLCVVGLLQKSMRADPWIIGAFCVYLLMGFISSLRIYGDIVYGYAPTHMAYLVLYGLACCLDGRRYRLMGRFFCLISFLLAFIAIAGFTLTSFWSIPTRIGVLTLEPNGLGIMMAMSFFLLKGANVNAGSEKGEASFDGCPNLPAALRFATGLLQGPSRFASSHLREIEPWVLVALTLTLSMGSMLALGLGIIIYLACKYRKKRQSSASKSGFFSNVVLPEIAKVAFCIALGLVMYACATLARLPILGLCLFGCVVYVGFIWRRFEDFLKRRRGVCALFAICAAACAIVAAIFRPSASATFAERVDMMANGIGYISQNPLFGVGVNQWRFLNLMDADTYFNTSRIHDAFIHIGVEWGIIAAIALAAIAIRFFIVTRRASHLAEGSAFLVHLLLDTGFFIPSIVCFFIGTAGRPDTRAINIGPMGTKTLFGLCGVLYLDSIVICLLGG